MARKTNRKRRRLYALGLAGLGLATATALSLTAFQDNLLFFYSPTELQDRDALNEQRFRLGGLVAEGSVEGERGGTLTRFVVTDTLNEVPVVYSGILPDLFREGQGVVANGRMTSDGHFQADEVLARHDENYMPPEVYEALENAESIRNHAEQTLTTDGEADP